MFREIQLLMIHRSNTSRHIHERHGDNVQTTGRKAKRFELQRYWCTTRILDQHHWYYEDSLLRYLAARRPKVEEDHRFPLIIWATVGAQSAAQWQVFANYKCTSDDPRWHPPCSSDAPFIWASLQYRWARRTIWHSCHLASINYFGCASTALIFFNFQI